MITALERSTVAKKKVGRPKSGRVDATVKADAAIVAKARLVATANNISLTEYISEILRAPVERDFAKEMRKVGGQPESKP